MARLEEYYREYAYRVYITKGIKHLAGMSMEYYEIVSRAGAKEVDSDEVKARILDGLRKLRGE